MEFQFAYWEISMLDAKAGEAAVPNSFRGIAVDVGNSALHFGWFNGAGAAYPQPIDVLVLERSTPDWNRLQAWGGAFFNHDLAWSIASVNDVARTELESWLHDSYPANRVCNIARAEVSIPIEVGNPDKVGIDRVLAIVAASVLGGMSPAIVIDAGTAITVDLLASGAFQGGAILPGMRMSAAALDRYTDKLPLVIIDQVDTPPVVGRNTQQATQSGIFWGTVGAIRELATRMSEPCSSPPRVFITGGDGPRLAPYLENAEYVPHMVLSGIALTAEHAEGGND